MSGFHRFHRMVRAPLLATGMLMSALFPGMPALAEAPLNLFVAASLADVAGDIAAEFQAETGMPARIVPAATSTLARQIADGAPADVFLSADPAWADWLIEKRGLLPDQARIFAGNGLVVVAAPNVAESAFAGLFDTGRRTRIALADPDHVPAGRYARAVLQADGRWPAIASRIVPAANVRGALRYVETGQIDFGIVYATDALSGTVRVVASLPDPVPPISYVAIALGPRDAAQHFVRFLAQPTAQTVLCRHGFRLPEEKPC